MRRPPPLVAFVNGREKHMLPVLHHDQLVRAAFGDAQPGVTYTIAWRCGEQLGTLGIKDSIEIKDGTEFTVVAVRTTDAPKAPPEGALVS